MNLPGYDAWKLDNPYDMTAEQEQAAIERDNEQQDDLREQIATALSDYRGDIYLATIRQIVIEELNKLAPRAGEPAWQTRTPVPIPGWGEAMNVQAELLRWLRTELNVICEATTSAPDLLSIASDGQFGSFARGRIHEAEKIKIKMGDIIQKKLNEYPAYESVRKA